MKFVAVKGKIGELACVGEQVHIEPVLGAMQVLLGCVSCHPFDVVDYAVFKNVQSSVHKEWHVIHDHILLAHDLERPAFDDWASLLCK